jgi:hypothetical protein
MNGAHARLDVKVGSPARASVSASVLGSWYPGVGFTTAVLLTTIAMLSALPIAQRE